MMLADAAKLGDVEIPVFCYEPKLGDPVGACRMCLVEIEGIPKLQTACSTPVKDGMVVVTQTDRVKEAQEAILEFLLINHPLDCPVCDKGGECPLQDITFGWGPGRSRFIEPKRHFVKPLALSPLIAIDRERCILCYRCVRFSQEIAEDYQLVLQERSADTYVSTFDGHPYVAPFSGNIIELCPVGALTSQPYRFRARPWDIEGSGSVCTLVPGAVQRGVHGPRRARPARHVAPARRRRRRLAVRQGPLRLPGGARRPARDLPAAARRRRARPGRLGPRVGRGGGAPERGRRGERRDRRRRDDERGGLAAAGAHARRARLAERRLAPRRHAAARAARRAAQPVAAGDRPGPRVRPRRARARLRADRRRARPGPAHPQGRAAQRRRARDRLLAPVRAGSQRDDRGALRARRRRGVLRGAERGARAAAEPSASSPPRPVPTRRRSPRSPSCSRAPARTS